ncbi:hypothetical protein KP509_11G057200 [Ceratopteris richardii]|uniref:Uncharacterized protein n=1 Tax=Ceratopteris richardii TaxID=49495 RepID=A0A8T2TV41_CERRI|nr:hypothetical protein KP509_11G057200 [Ceratopteris richardii]
MQMTTITIAFAVDEALHASIAEDDAVISTFLSTYHGDATQRATCALSSCAASVSVTSPPTDIVVKTPLVQLLREMGLRILSANEDHIACSGLPCLLEAPSTTFTFYQWCTSFPPPVTVLVTATVLYAGDVDEFHQPSLRSTSFPPPDTILVIAMVLHAGDV